VSTLPVRDRSDGANLLGLLFAAALAALVHSGLVAASIVLEWRRGQPDGFTAGVALDLAAFLPALVVLLAMLRLAQTIDSTSLYRSSLWLFVCNGVRELLLLIPTRGLGDGPSLFLTLVVGVSVLAGIGLSIWYGLVLVRLREQLGGLAVLVGWIELARTAAWVIFKVFLVVGLAQGVAGARAEPDMDQVFDKVGALDRLDQIRALVGRVLTDLLLFCFFLALCDNEDFLPGQAVSSPKEGSLGAQDHVAGSTDLIVERLDAEELRQTLDQGQVEP
jgi:hypothetical protein